MAKKVLVLILALAAAVLPAACSAQPAATEAGHNAGDQVNGSTVTTSGPGAEGTVAAGGLDRDSTATVVVTRDFGRELVLERETVIEPGTSAMEALQAVAEVATKYGGRFISSIRGIAGGNGGTEDWFIYINGIAANVGAGDIVLRAGDVEHWDFRDWSYRQFIPAIIGDYPQPFRSGSGADALPTLVVYEEPFAAEAGSLVEALEKDGVAPVSAVGSDTLSGDARGRSNLIIIAGPGNALVSEMNKAHKQLGLYAYFDEGGIVVLDAKGELSAEYGPGTGLLQATQNPWNPRGVGAGENVAWTVTGVDADGVRSAAAALVNNGDGLRRAFAAVVSEGGIVRIP
jgi:hypothetical protein